MGEIGTCDNEGVFVNKTFEYGGGLFDCVERALTCNNRDKAKITEPALKQRKLNLNAVFILKNYW